MKKHKICIIGDGLAGLTSALALKTLNIEIDLYFSKTKAEKIDKRITAISDSNYKFIKKIEPNLNKKIIWSCSKIKLFYENNNSIFNFLNFSEKNNIIHIFENEKFKNEIKKNLRSKKVKLIKKEVQEISIKNGSIKINKKNYYYDLILLCLGNTSYLYQYITNNRSINKDYKEVAITGYAQHSEVINNPSQYFLDEGPLAILPYSKTSFSFVWTLNKKFYLENVNDLKYLVRKKISSLLKTKNNMKISKVWSYPIKLNLLTRYYKKNTLILGEGLHSVHPLAGQGFNLVLRDISKLYGLIKRNIELGLQIKNSQILKDFSFARKPENNLFGLGIDVTNTFFKKNKYFDLFKKPILDNISNFSLIKKISRIVSDKGISF